MWISEILKCCVGLGETTWGGTEILLTGGLDKHLSLIIQTTLLLLVVKADEPNYLWCP